MVVSRLLRKLEGDILDRRRLGCRPVDSGDARFGRDCGRVEDEVADLTVEDAGGNVCELRVALVAVGVENSKTARDVEGGRSFDDGHGGRVTNQLCVEEVED